MILVMNRFLIKGHFNFSPNKCYHQNLLSLLNKMIYIYIYTVEPPRKGHFGTNINSSGLSPL